MKFPLFTFDLKLLWLDYYNERTTNFQELTNQSFSSTDTQKSFSYGDVYILYCYFQKLTSSNGGAICYDVVNGHFLGESSTFEQCSTSSHGGALWLNSGDCVMNKLCGYQCSCSNTVGFSDVYGSGKKIIYLHDSTIARCPSQASTLYLRYGNIEVKSSNVSYNAADRRPAMYCEPDKENSEGYGTTIFYSSIANNTGMYCIFLDHWQSPRINNSLMHHCNMIQNIGSEILVSSVITQIISSCILANGEPLFSSFKLGGTFIVSECTIDSFSYASPCSIFSDGSKNYFINSLNHILTGSCQNILDWVGTKLPFLSQKTNQRFNIKYSLIMSLSYTWILSL